MATPEAPGPIVVKIGDLDVRLQVPDSYSVALDVVAAAGKNPTRALAAALGVCWTGPLRPGGAYERCGYDPLLYGGKVRDALMKRDKITDEQVSDATARAFEMLSDVLIEPDEVKGAEGN